MALEGLALCYGDNEGDYQRAIYTMEEAIRCLPDTEGWGRINFYLRTSMARWMLKLNDNDVTLEVARSAFEGSRGYVWGVGGPSDDGILSSIKCYIEALYRVESYSDIVQLLSELQQTATNVGESLLSVFLRAQMHSSFNVDLFEKAGEISRLLRNKKVLATMKSAIEEGTALTTNSISNEERVVLALNGGAFLYRLGDTTDESAALYDKLVAVIEHSNEAVQQMYTGERTTAADQLAQILLHDAILTRSQGKDTSIAIAKLEDLAKHKQGGERYYRASYPALALSLWLREYEKTDDTTWKACVRPSITQALNLLSDNDPWNDQQAYCQLGLALLFAGDAHNAAIAIGITTRPLEDEQQVAKNQEVTDEPPADNSAETEPISGGNEVAEHMGTGMTEPAIEQSPDSSALEGTPSQKEDACSETENSRFLDQEAPQEGSAPDQEATKGETDEHPVPSTDEVETSSNFRYTGFELVWSCDGPCKKEMQDYKALHFCRFCVYVCFCEECIELVRADKIPYRCCSSGHQHVKVFPMTDDARRVTEALVERRFEEQQEWLDRLRAAWIDSKV